MPQNRTGSAIRHMADDQSNKTMNSVLTPDPEAVRTAVIDFASSELFQRTFDDGMALVEETAAYLDGPGREESKDLPRRGALASWMLVVAALVMIGAFVVAHPLLTGAAQ